jgi:iron complex outermembrane recepter protein
VIVESFSRVAVLAFVTVSVGAWAGMAWAGTTGPVEDSTSSRPSDAAAGSDPDLQEVVVTGNRLSGGITQADSLAPVEVLSSDALSHVGQPNLDQALTQLVPSFTAESIAGDTAKLTLTGRLRGLSPNDLLVLVNGKRRHPTANLQVLAGESQGGAAPDLGLIPPAAIERIEVLEDGAAAQYGSDAIAGVINIILKHDNHGSWASADGGQYYKGDGTTYSGTGRLGTTIGGNGFLDLTFLYRFHDFSQRGGPDARVADQNGNVLPSLTPAQTAAAIAMPGFPYINRYNGDARSRLGSTMYNAGYDFDDVQIYSFGSYSSRTGDSYGNVRLPWRVVASPVLGVAGNFGDPGELVFAPQGFNPIEHLDENDYAITGGVKGDAAGWHWDLSSTYGLDQDDIGSYDTANASLFVDTHATPTNFNAGGFVSGEWTTNLDVSKEIDTGQAKPINLAFGAEYRRDRYEIKPGEPLSYYKEGAQNYPGFQPTDATDQTRTNKALYVDLALQPTDPLKLDAAARYENYSDFGSKVTEKLTGRYDFTPAFALRGTVSTGFRAPTLAEEFYSATNVAPSYAIVQLPANSPAAKLLGFGNLKPERSTNFSAGLVARPAENLTLTLDAYQVGIRDRVVATGTLYGSGGAINSPAVLEAIAAHGNTLDPTVTLTGVSLFTNGMNTRTRGADFVAAYRSSAGSLGSFDWTLSANYSTTSVTRIGATPLPVQPQPLFDQTALSYLETASPRYKAIAGVLWTRNALSINLRETAYGPASAEYSPDGGIYTRNTSNVAWLTDLETSYKFTDHMELAIGANNLFDRQASTIRLDQLGRISDGLVVYRAPLGFSPYGIDGGYYYGRINFTF